ncbi:helix-turn-helix domain-containing protein [Alistipes timonensis]|uniref:helix-turn-helix domain-containing protein n=1 Tax=Alistipes timonensis TaxID=1465754 RepID=UPI001C3D32F2|nr:helix-turn-helix domain-containing protein [Alistipes timonensis]MCR2031468.1 helix-turn-helix domain-containing protein [Alistipes timonensis]
MDNSRCDYDLLEAVVRKLKQLREAKGLSQRIVYIDTDFNIGKIEVGKTNITISTLSRLCNYYGTSLKEFFNELDQ